MRLPVDLLRSTSPMAWPHHRAVSLCMFALAVFLAGGGVERMGRMAASRAVAAERSASAAVLPYRSALPALHALAGDTLPRPMAFVRLETASCSVRAAFADDRRVAWLDLGDPAPACGGSAPRAMAASGRVRAEVGEARWLIVDRDGRVRYSRRTSPEPERLARLLDLFDPAKEPR